MRFDERDPRLPGTDEAISPQRVCGLRFEREHDSPCRRHASARAKGTQKRVRLKVDARSPLGRRLYHEYCTPIHENCLPNSIPQCGGVGPFN